jgi:hypothetical protein
MKDTTTRCPHHSIVQLEQGDKITTQCTACGKNINVVKKPKCSCYGGFDCEVCNPDYYEEQEINDTTRCPHCGAERGIQYWNVFECGTEIYKTKPAKISPLCIERSARQKAEAEVALLREALSFIAHGTTTHDSTEYYRHIASSAIKATLK